MVVAAISLTSRRGKWRRSTKLYSVLAAGRPFPFVGDPKSEMVSRTPILE